MNFMHIKALIALFFATLVVALCYELYIKRRRRKLKWIMTTLAQMRTITDADQIHELGEEIVTLVNYYGILPSDLGWESFEGIPVFGVWHLTQQRHAEEQNLAYWRDLGERFQGAEYTAIPPQIEHAQSRLVEIDFKLTP